MGVTLRRSKKSCPTSLWGHWLTVTALAREAGQLISTHQLQLTTNVINIATAIESRHPHQFFQDPDKVPDRAGNLQIASTKGRKTGKDTFRVFDHVLCLRAGFNNTQIIHKLSLITRDNIALVMTVCFCHLPMLPLQRKAVKIPSHGKSPLRGYPPPRGLHGPDFSEKLTGKT